MIKAWSYLDEYKVLRKKILKSIDISLKSGQIFFGNELNIFEKKFIKKNNLKYGVAVGSGTDALYIALLALGIGKGNEVITVSNTAIPTVSAIKSSGADVKFVDINNDYLIDVNKIEKCISKRTKAIIPVHLYGLPCDMAKICKIAKKYKLKIIEDCAQAQGAKFNNKYFIGGGHSNTENNTLYLGLRNSHTLTMGFYDNDIAIIQKFIDNRSNFFVTGITVYVDEPIPAQ